MVRESIHQTREATKLASQQTSSLEKLMQYDSAQKPKSNPSAGGGGGGKKRDGHKKGNKDVPDSKTVGQYLEGGSNASGGVIADGKGTGGVVLKFKKSVLDSWSSTPMKGPKTKRSASSNNRAKTTGRDSERVRSFAKKWRQFKN